MHEGAGKALGSTTMAAVALDGDVTATAVAVAVAVARGEPGAAKPRGEPRGEPPRGEARAVARGEADPAGAGVAVSGARDGLACFPTAGRARAEGFGDDPVLRTTAAVARPAAAAAAAACCSTAEASDGGGLTGGGGAIDGATDEDEVAEAEDASSPSPIAAVCGPASSAICAGGRAEEVGTT